MKEKENVYTEHGFKNRKDYLEYLADEYGMDYSNVLMLATLLGETEDFDGLISALEDSLYFM